jgi:hypothetical protein
MKTTNTPIDPLITRPQESMRAISNIDAEKIKRLSGSETKKKSGISKKAAAFAVGLTVVAGAYLANDQISKADQRAAISFEQDNLQNAPKTVLNGELVLSSGVRLRSTPAISNPSEESEGNIDFVVAEGMQVVVDNPVAFELTPEDIWYAINLKSDGGVEDGPDTLWVSSEVMSQLNDSGEPFARFTPQENQDLLGAEVSVNQLGVMSANGQTLAMGYIQEAQN